MSPFDESSDTELRCEGTVWLFNGDSCDVVESPTLRIADTDLAGWLERPQGGQSGGHRKGDGGRAAPKVTLNVLRNSMVVVRSSLPPSRASSSTTL